MTFQSVINYDYGFGVVGEIMRNGPTRAHSGLINTSAGTTNNIFGRMFTLNTDNKTVQAGGSGALWGILGNPKQHASFGGSAGPLSPTIVLPNQVIADFLEMGKIVVQLGSAAVIGAQLQYATATGIISVPAVPGTPDSGNVLFEGSVEDFPQPNANNLALIKLAGLMVTSTSASE